MSDVLTPDELRSSFMQREYSPQDVERLLVSHACLVRERAEFRAVAYEIVARYDKHCGHKATLRVTVPFPLATSIDKLRRFVEEPS